MILKFIVCQRPGWKRISHNQGFTVLEVICSLLITGLVALTVLAVVNQSFGLWQSSWFWGEEDRGIRLVARSMEEFSSKLYGGDLPKGESKGFTGDFQEFSGLLEGEDGLIRTGVLWEPQKKIILFWQETLQGSQEKILCTRVEEAEFSYLDREHGSWSDRWTDQTPLPAGIRLRWKIAKKSMPAVIVSIQNGRRIAAP